MTQKEKLMSFFKDDLYIPMTTDDIILVLDVPNDDKEEFLSIINELVCEGYIIKTKKNRFALAENMGFVSGKFQSTERGFGFLICDDKDDIFIPENRVNGALNGDTVLVRITSKKTATRRSEGEVVSVLKRENKYIVGTFSQSRNFGFVIPDDKKLKKDIFISKYKSTGTKDGDKVVCEIIDFASDRKNPEGIIIENLGASYENGVDVKAVIRRFNIRDKFDKKLLCEADKIPDFVSEKEIKGRCDFRGDIVITIDGADAKDLDDAVCVKKSENGYQLCVHIADVTHYVLENSIIDKEAFERATSVYFADRVIPMLPKKLSNGICSLNPKVDRLTLSVIMDIDSNGDLINSKIVEGVIKTKERMTYDDVAKILVDDDLNLKEKYGHILESLYLMNELALLLKGKRLKKGGIDFDFPETKIIFDENGKVADIKRRENTIANSIIEEFMLMCNKTIAETFFWASVPFVYRVHEKPSQEKITSFNEFIKNMGYTLKGSGEIHPKAFATLLDKIKNTPYERIISTAMLRSLMKAKYKAENEGHFGLAFEYYCHFTSPIRRYPDLAIHRIIKEFIKTGITEERNSKLLAFTQSVALNSSEKEVNAENAEREVEDIKKAEFMHNKIGEEFSGIISSVTSFGFFVELENSVEGLVRIAELDDDYYIYDEKNFALIGERKHKVYKIGDAVRIIVAGVDVASHQIDFVLK
ncbi:MAG: ribonuclease R [Ruminococcaceae bacterium]|nr:ribonuclease R [Oscillospiraceae bacterium]